MRPDWQARARHRGPRSHREPWMTFKSGSGVLTIMFQNKPGNVSVKASLEARRLKPRTL